MTLDDPGMVEMHRAAKESRASKVLRVAWMAVALGVAIQVLVLCARLLAGGPLPGAAFVAEIAQGVSWAFIVCAGVAIGMAVHRARPAMGGLLGLVSGPLGWGAAKAVQRFVQALLGVPVDQFGTFFLILCGIKAAEYFALGAVLAWLTEQPDKKALHYALAGGAIGVLASIVVVVLSVNHGLAVDQPMATAKIVGLAVSELTFPIGCALVIYAPFHLKRFVGLN